MKNKLLFLLLFMSVCGFSQSVNDYKAVIIPTKYDFQKSDNEFRLQTITKMGLQKAGFQAFYANESKPSEFQDKCSLLYVEVVKENVFYMTKLYILLRDCSGIVVYKSASAKINREKEFEVAYKETLNEVFEFLYALNYKYNGIVNFSSKAGITTQTLPVMAAPTTDVTPTSAAPVVPIIPATAVPAVVIPTSNNAGVTSNNGASDLLYAQPTSYGYQLIDSEPKVVIKAYKTSSRTTYLAKKGNIQGALVYKYKLEKWFFEYYQNDKLISEKVEVKF